MYGTTLYGSIMGALGGLPPAPAPGAAGGSVFQGAAMDEEEDEEDEEEV